MSDYKEGYDHAGGLIEKDCGGFAFPSQWDDKDNEGMTLRDWFAGQALSNTAGNYRGTAFDPVGIARIAYEYADAMLEARK